MIEIYIKKYWYIIKGHCELVMKIILSAMLFFWVVREVFICMNFLEFVCDVFFFKVNYCVLWDRVNLLFVNEGEVFFRPQGYWEYVRSVSECFHTLRFMYMYPSYVHICFWWFLAQESARYVCHTVAGVWWGTVRQFRLRPSLTAKHIEWLIKSLSVYKKNKFF